MAELYVNVNGTWKQASNYYVNVNGTWKEGSELHAKVSSAWKESGGVYGGTSGIVTTNIVLDLDVTNSSSYGGSGTTWTDLSGQGNNATLVNGPTYYASHGGYLSFDGSNDHATLPAIDISGNEITFSIWTFAQSDTTASLIFLGDSTDTSGWNGRQLNVHLPYTNSYYFDKGHDGTTVDRINGSLPNSDWQNAWVNWTFTANASTGSMKIYRNAELYASGTGKTRTLSNANGDIRRIARTGGSAHYDGYISKILLYKKELTASEVLQNYNATKSDYVDLITTNLVLHLDASNTSSYGGSGTTWTDLSSSTNNGTLTNGPTFNSQDGGAIVFDGTNDYVQTSSIIFNPNANFTFSIWLNADALATDTSYVFIGNFNNNSSFMFRYRNGIQIVKSGVLINGTFSSSTLSTNTWYNLTITRTISGSTRTYTLFINGNSISSFTDGNDFDYGSSSIGTKYTSDGSGAQFFDGKIGQVFAYSSAFSASEVLQNYNATKGNFLGDVITTNLVLHLDAGKSMSYSGSGTTWKDFTSNSNDATLTNGPTFDSDFGGSIVFDGTNDSVTISGMSSFAPSAVTFEVWFLNTPGSGYKGLVDKGRDNYEGYSLAASSSKVQWKARVGSSNEVALDSAEYTNIWNHAVGTYDGTDLKLYVNGVLKTTTNSSGTLGSNSLGITIGSTNDNLYFDGRISQVRIYSSALSASNVLSNYNATKDAFGYATVSDPSGIIATGLDILLDAGNSNSYSGSGTTWTNIAPSSSVFGDATLRTDTNVNTYSSSNGGYFSKPRAYMVNSYNTGSGAGAAYKTMTYSVWCYITNISGYQSLIDQGNDMWLLTTVPSGGNDLLMVYNPSFSYNLNSPSTSGAAINKWYNFTMTHTEGDVVKMYINGLKVYTSSGTTSSGSGFTNWSFGAGSLSSTNSGNEGWAGYIATIAVYNRALSATEVLQNHNALKSRFGL